MKKFTVSALSLLVVLITGFAAYASKPDFAYPKQVSKTARKELKNALRIGNGPAVVRSVINLSLADLAADPDSVNMVEQDIAMTASKVKDPATWAMLQLLRADVTDSVRWADSALVYTDALRRASVKEWREVIVADSVYIPTLYDFAVSMRLDMQPSDSLLSQVLEFHKGEPAPYMYWSLRKNPEWSNAVDLYGRYRHLRASSYLLLWMQHRTQDDADIKALYDMTVEWLGRFGSYKPVAQLRDALSAPSVRIESREICVPDSMIHVKVAARNVNDMELALYAIKPSQAYLSSIPLHFDGSGVFKSDTVVSVYLPGYGQYKIVPVLAGEKRSVNDSGCEVAVTDFMIVDEVFGNGKSNLLALDAITGDVVDGVQFSHDRNRWYGTLGADRYSPSLWSGRHYFNDPKQWQTAANILTDRSIYHPGDTVKFAATLYRFNALRRALCDDTETVVNLYDANYRQVSSISLQTDSLGRVDGKFVLPTSGLKGTYSLQIADGGSAYFSVSDYKAPAFEVKATAERLDSTRVKVTGTALNYSGFPVQGGSVSVIVNKLRPRVWFWNFMNEVDERIARISALTDSAGAFTAIVDVPQHVALGAMVTVTSMAGESHDTNCFVPGKPYYISADFPRSIKVAADAPTWIPPVSVMDAAGKAVEFGLSYRLISSSDTIEMGDKWVWSEIPSGLYTIYVNPDNSAMADTVEIEKVAIYRSSDKTPPLATSLWVPESSVECGTELLCGTSFADSHIRYVIWTADTILERKWINPCAGNFRVPVELPDSVDEATLMLWTVRDYETSTAVVKVKRPAVVRSLKLQVSSLRDRIVAGDRELWTIRVTDNLGNPVENAAVMLDVYSKALDALAPFRFDFPIYGNSGYSYRENIAGENRQYGYSAKYLQWPSVPGEIPAFNLYDRRWPRTYTYCGGTTNTMLRVRGMGKMQASAMVEESMIEDSADGGIELREEKETQFGSVTHFDSAATEDAETGNASNESTYRLSEVPTAMWAPALTTGADGTLQLQFVAPNANTTWVIKALAYNSNLVTGDFSADIIASKPVMVQTSLPRFLRIGDRLDLMATVMNNTDSLQIVDVTVELFDPATNRVIGRMTYNNTDSIAARSSKVISVPYTADNRTMVGYRISASAGNFTDGERVIIPVLPSMVSVTDSRAFFVPADSASVRLDVPSESVVEVTGNAVWECVTALPGLQSSESKSAFSVSAALFSAAVADGLLRSYPEISRALHRWEKEDSALVSNLLKNEDLKIALLENTPWPGAAQDDSERMARLLLLFDKKQVSEVIEKSVDALAHLVRKGGLVWTADCEEPSEWVTERVLTTLAQLRRLGYLPADRRLQQIISEGIQYLDKDVARRFVKHPKADYMDYVDMRMAFSDIPQPSTARKVTVATVQRLVADWRDLSLRDKARAAMILNANGYQATARGIIESLRQYKAWRQTGLGSTVLNAFADVEPNSADVDEIRQWLISRKQSMDWGNGLRTSDMIASILSTGKGQWLVPAENSINITVNGVEIRHDAEAVVGTFRIDLPKGGIVEVHKGAYPAWGGVWTRISNESADVKAAGCDQMSVSRLVSGDLKVGSKVTVTVVIESDRQMDYVVVKSPRPAAFEPVQQLSRPLWNFGLKTYIEPSNTLTTFFIDRLPKGRTVLTEEFYVSENGSFVMAPAEVQSQYAPEFSSHSSGESIEIR